MDIMDFNKLESATAELEEVLCKLEDSLPDNDYDEGTALTKLEGDTLCKLVMAVSDAWLNLEGFCREYGRNPQDIIKEKRSNMENKELTKEQLEQVDFIHNVAYNAMCGLLDKDLEWDIEWVGEIADALSKVAVDYFGKTLNEVYPDIEE